MNVDLEQSIGDWERDRRNAAISEKIKVTTAKLIAAGPDACRAWIARLEKQGK